MVNINTRHSFDTQFAILDGVESHTFFGRKLPVTCFNPEKTNFGPFGSMTEESRLRVLGHNYWREGNIVAEFLVREADALRTSFIPSSVYGLFKIFAHFHGGNPFDRSALLTGGPYSDRFPEDRYCWGANVIPVPGRIKFKESPTQEALKQLAHYYDDLMKRPRGTYRGDIVFRNCENPNFAGETL